MPALPTKTARRKHLTPVANLHDNDLWQRTFKLLDLEPLTAFADRLDLSTMGEDAEMTSTDTAPAPKAVEQKKKAPTILDLPSETQKEIFKHASTTDLVALSLVSKHFRDVAAAQLYRNFHIVFPDEDDRSYESPIDGLAGGLDTLVTSDYNYARYLKEIVLDTLSGGAKGERAYRHYTYDLSCGKFMNTLFVLALRKAYALETFRWELRVEITRPLFKTLHQLSSLQHLHLRMQAGPSLYEIPPPLPSLEVPDPSASAIDNPFSSPSGITSPPPSIMPKNISFARLASNSTDKRVQDTLSTSKIPPTFSGFRNLKSLSVLDMDTLDYVTEIRACIRASSSTLSKLRLSFSEDRASKARKPPPVEDPGDDSDQDIDEFGNMVPPPPPPPPAASSLDDVSGPAKAFRAQEEKKLQEGVLGRILDVEPFSIRKPYASSENESDSEEKVDEKKVDPGQAFVNDLTTLFKKLNANVNGPGTRTQQQKDALELIEKAAKMYVEAKTEQDAKLAKESKTGDETVSIGSSTAKVTPESSAASTTEKTEDSNNQNVKLKATDGGQTSGLFDDHEKKSRKSEQFAQAGPKPEDINVDEPEIEGDLKEFDDVSTSEAQSDAKTSESDAISQDISENNENGLVPLSPKERRQLEVTRSGRREAAAQLENFKNLKTRLVRYKCEMDELNERLKISAATGEVDMDTIHEAKSQQLRIQAETDTAIAQLRTLEAEVSDFQRRAEAASETSQETEATEIKDYIRSTRGLGLQSLAIYLIPIKTSVLSKSIDFSVLQRITLLNVGPQAPFWNHLAKENKLSPLSLQKIFTDNVTPHFLMLVSQLDRLTELFMLERTSKIPDYSLASKTTVTIDEIRKLVLKKHIDTLEKLMIKNENDWTWDATERVIKLVCKRGKLLEELAMSFGMRVLHTFNQFLPGLGILRALHIINLRNDDTCHSIFREVRKFAVDNVSHHPDMKLEYIAIEGNVEKIVKRRKKPLSKGKGKATTKGKGKEAPAATLDPAAFPSMDMILLLPTAGDSSEGEDFDDDGYDGGLKLDTLEGVRFYDVRGVRMFRKDVMMGRL